MQRHDYIGSRTGPVRRLGRQCVHDRDQVVEPASFRLDGPRSEDEVRRVARDHELLAVVRQQGAQLGSMVREPAPQRRAHVLVDGERRNEDVEVRELSERDARVHDATWDRACKAEHGRFLDLGE